MFQATREVFPRVSEADEGRYVPFLYGPYKRSSPIAYLHGQHEKLAEAIPTATSTAPIKASSIDSLKRFVAPGKLQIRGERISFTGINLANLTFTGIVRKVDGTIASEHPAGTVIYEVLAAFRYLVCENPRVVHFTKAVVAVYLDGALKAADIPPKHTINLDDRAVVAGRSFVTITLDIASIPPERITIPSPPPPPVREEPAAVRSSPPTTPTGYASSGGGGGSDGIYRLPIPPRPPIPTIGGVALPRPPIIRYSHAPPVIGELEVDVDGLKDDPAGTVTGTPNTWMDRPAWQVRTQLREAWGERDDTFYNLPSFTTTHALQVTDGLRWAQAYSGEPFSQWRDGVLLQGKAHLFNQGGKWHYVYRRRPPAGPVYTFDRDTFQGEGPTFGFTPRTDLTTELPVVWNRHIFQRRFVLTSGRGVPKYGIIRTRSLSLPWVFEEPVARFLGLYWLSQWDQQRVLVTIRTAWEAGMRLEGIDGFAVDTPIMAKWGKAQVIFHVHDVVLDTDRKGFIITGEQADDGGKVLSGRVRVVRTVPTVLSGKVVVGNPPLRPSMVVLTGGLGPGLGSLVAH